MANHLHSVHGPRAISPRSQSSEHEPAAGRRKDLSGADRSRDLLADAAFSAFTDSRYQTQSGAQAQPLQSACLLYVELGRRTRDDDAPLMEFVGLAQAGGVQLCGLYQVYRMRPSPKYFIGSGKAEQIRDHLQQNDVHLLIVNHDLSPSQERNLERLCGVRVLDRSGLILDIFSQRACSHEGKLQVELAQLDYLSTRLVRGWSHLERQKGGIGLRGPGEKQLETDRRLIGKRMADINKRLERIKSRRCLGRRMRKKRNLTTIALVGYTNAGKTALFNRLTASAAYSADQLFATLDPVMRRLDLGVEVEGVVSNRAEEAVLSDTVGFISDLPHTLIEAFNATLLEVCEADLLLHVVDAAAAEHIEYQCKVEQVLQTIGADRIPTLVVFNKSDLTRHPPTTVRDEEGRAVSVTLSASTGDGVAALKRVLAELITPRTHCYVAQIPPDAGGLRSFAYAKGEVIHEEYRCDGGWYLRLRLSDKVAGALLKYADDLGCALELSKLPK